jgi:hypothetical protein
MMQGKRAGGGQHGKSGGADNARQAGGRGRRTQHKAAVEAALLSRSFALRGGGYLRHRWVLRGGGNGTHADNANDTL